MPFIFGIGASYLAASDSGDSVADCPLKLEAIDAKCVTVAGENAILTFRLSNIGTTDLTLQSGPLSSCFLRMRLRSENDDREGTRIDSHSFVRSPRAIVTLSADESIEIRLFINNEPELLVKTQDESAYRVEFEARFAWTSDETSGTCTLKSPVVEWVIAVPSATDQLIYDSVRDLKKTEQYGSRKYLETLDRIIQQNAGHPLIPQLQLSYLRASRRLMYGYQNDPSAVPDAFYEAFRQTLDRGEPYAPIILSKNYAEFLLIMKKWELLERTAQVTLQCYRAHPELREVALYIGSGSVFLDHKQLMIPEEWQQRLESPFLNCLSVGLERENAAVVETARRLLPKLEEKGKWHLVKKAANRILKADIDDEAAQAALSRARDQLQRSGE